jgi:hypothetical protein
MIYNLLSISSSNFAEGFLFLWDSKRSLLLTGLSQLLVAIAFVIQDRIRNGTELLNSDKVALSFLSVETLTHSVHAVLNIAMINNMVTLVQPNNPKLYENAFTTSKPSIIAQDFSS